MCVILPMLSLRATLHYIREILSHDRHKLSLGAGLSDIIIMLLECSNTFTMSCRPLRDAVARTFMFNSSTTTRRLNQGGKPIQGIGVTIAITVLMALRALRQH